MFECQSCGCRFSRAQTIRESRGECFGFPAWETFEACPRCGGAFIDLYPKGGSCQ